MAQFIDSFVLVFAGLLLVGALLALGSLIGRKGAPWLGVLVPVAGVVAILAGTQYALERYGAAGRATVVSKVEWATLQRNGSFQSHHSITIKQIGEAVGGPINMRTDQALFDSLAAGDIVAVQWLPVHPSFVQLDRMTAAHWMAIVTASGIVSFVVGIAAMFVGLFLYGGVGALGAVRTLLAITLLLGGAVAIWSEMKPYAGVTDFPAHALAARAKVTRLRTVTGLYPVRQRGGSRKGWQLRLPYTVVEAAFTPTGARSPVVGIDAIDDGSVPTLQVGSLVDVEYDPSRARVMRLTAATRQWTTTNARDRWLAVAVLGGVIAGLMLLGAVGRRRRSPSRS